MRFSENRKAALGVLVLCILVSIFALGGSALARDRKHTLEVFNDGTDVSLSTRHSMDAYLDSAADSAKVMASEAELHMGASDLIKSAESLADVIVDGDDLDARFEAYTSLKTDVDKLYNVMYNAAKGDAFNNFKFAYDDFWGYDDMIKRDEYHQKARSYNKAAGGFPGTIIAKLLGLGELNAFGG